MNSNLPANPAYDKEDKGKGKIENLRIEILDDGSFYYCASTDKGDQKDYSYKSVDEVLKAVKDDLTSPHLRQPKLGSGGRFAALKSELSRKPGIYDPGGLAAKIGRAKWGKTKFQAMAAKGRKNA